MRADYESPHYANYPEARRLLAGTASVWMDVAKRHAAGRSCARVLDLGSGTGRFTPLLAAALNAAVVGVEPSDQMRTLAERQASGPRVTYVKGSAEAMPCPDRSFDLAWASMMIHHVVDRAACAAELVRVLRPGGRVIVRNSFRDRLDSIPLYRYFDRAREIDERRLPSVEELLRIFGAAGLSLVADERIEQVLDENLAAYRARLGKGGISTLERLPATELADGLARLDRDVARADPARPVRETITALVFAR